MAQATPMTGPVPRIDDRFTWSGQQSAAFNDMFVTAREERGWRLLWQLVGEDPPHEVEVALPILHAVVPWRVAPDEPPDMRPGSCGLREAPA